MAMFAAYDALSTPFAEVATEEKDVDFDTDAYDAKKLVSAYRASTKDAKDTNDEIKRRHAETETMCGELTAMMDTCRKIIHTLAMEDIENIDVKKMEGAMKQAQDVALEFKKHFVTHEENAIRELKEKETKLQANLSRLREALVKGAALMCPKETIVQSNVCPICFEKEVNRVCVPCGHTLCSTCEFSVLEKCATCRRYVDMCIPLYFSL